MDDGDTATTFSAKERFDACMDLSNHFVAHFESRRSYEWKIAFGIWSLLGAACITLRGRQDLPLWAMVVLVLLFEVTWLWNIWRRNRNDRDAHRHYRTEAERILLNPSHSASRFVFEEKPSAKRVLKMVLSFLADWAMLFQGTTTIFLAWAAYHFNHAKP